MRFLPYDSEESYRIECKPEINWGGLLSKVHGTTIYFQLCNKTKRLLTGGAGRLLIGRSIGKLFGRCLPGLRRGSFEKSKLRAGRRWSALRQGRGGPRGAVRGWWGGGGE